VMVFDPGRIGSATSKSRKFSSKKCSFFQFFVLSGMGLVKNTQVSPLFTASQKYAQVGSMPISSLTPANL